MRFLLSLYDYLNRHRLALWGSLAVVCVALVAASLTLNFSEDIADFLPLDRENQRAMQCYQEFADADRIMVLFEDTTADLSRLLDAVDAYQACYEADTTLPELTTQVDMERYTDGIDRIYRNAPYFLTEADYVRMDSLLGQPGYIDSQLRADRQQLLLPMSSFVASRIQADPLNLFGPVVERLRAYLPQSEHFGSTDGYMVSADQRWAFAYLTTPYGSSETRRNAQLVATLNRIGEEVMQSQEGVQIRLLGAPVIAVGNARQIKTDSIVAIGLAVVLILLLLLGTFRHPKEIGYILLTVAFGMLCGMATMAVVCRTVSLIVIGIGTIIIGIAVNYPLHVVVHRHYTADTRTNLQEVLSPLIIGNITTVAAFLTLIPLRAVALRDLGIFAAAMLVGTILFSVVYLPHLLPREIATEPQQETIFPRLSRFALHKSRLAMGLLVGLTVVLAFFSTSVEFDADLSHINYMTPQQRKDMAYFASLVGEKASSHTAYVVFSGEEWSDIAQQSEARQGLYDSLLAAQCIAGRHSAVSYLPSKAMQWERLERWAAFRKQWSGIGSEMVREGRQYGFAEQAFAPFLTTLQTDFAPQEAEFFLPTAELFFHGYYRAADTTRHTPWMLVDKLNVPIANEEKVLARLKEGAAGSMRSNLSARAMGSESEAEAMGSELGAESGSRTENASKTETAVFTIERVNAQITESLSENFNYIGAVCSAIVFIFLWLSFRNLWLAVVAFLPMVVSWIWIFGLMHLFGIQFNIINIILAAFVFGQGDDYTIFMVEGLDYERRTGKSILPQFRSEVLLSALILLIGIGVLVVSKHPAMFSLGAVTLIGMTSVVLMAFTLPALLFKMKDFIKRKWGQLTIKN